MVAVGRVERDAAQGARALWAHVFGEGKGFLCIFSGRRAANGGKQLVEVEESFWPYPQSATFAEQEAYQQDALGREVYFCAHLLREKRRRKEAAAPIHSLWVDGDGARCPYQIPQPSVQVHSSVGRAQFFWRLAAPVEPEVAQALNRRLAYGLGADKGGWDLTQLLRVPGCHNRKYPDAPEVEVGYIDDTGIWPVEALEPLIPPPVKLGGEVPAPRPAPDDNGDSAPPVRLDAAGLAWWRGERTATKEDGSVDRSETLWGIARALWACGASAGTVAAALAERDAALGYGRYTDRPAEYLRIVGKLGDAPPLSTVDTPPLGCPEWQGRAEAAEARLKAIHELMTCKGMTPLERVLAYGLINEEASARSRGKVDKRRPELAQISPRAVADNLGIGRQTVGATLKRWDERGYLEAEVVEDEEDGTRMTAVRLPAGDQLSNLALAQTWTRPAGAKHVGGNGNRCPKCDSGEVKKEVERATIETTKITCASCGEVHSVTRRVVGQTATAISFEDVAALDELADDWGGADVDNDVVGGVSTVDRGCSGSAQGTSPTVETVVGDPCAFSTPPLSTVDIPPERPTVRCLSASRGCVNRVPPDVEYCPVCEADGWRNDRGAL